MYIDTAGTVHDILYIKKHAARLSRILPTVIGAHQHGFMVQRGIQEPSLLATHLIQDAVHYSKPLQL